MSKTQKNYSENNYDSIPSTVGIDFSKTMDVTTPDGIPDFYEEKEAELVSFQRTDKVIRPIRSKATTGTFQSQREMANIIGTDQKDIRVKVIIDKMRDDSSKIPRELNEDISLLRDFFPIDLVNEVHDYCLRNIPKIEKIIEEQNLKRLTPRRRRGYVLAIFKSMCRKNGRKITEEMLEEINNRFGYERQIKLFEVSKAESDLIHWNLLARKPEREPNDLKMFYLNVINNINLLKKNEKIRENPTHLKVITLTQRWITKFAADKKHKKNLYKLLKHQDKDFFARLLIWSIAKFFAEEELGEHFRTPEETPGWIDLFLIKNAEEEIAIRSLKFVFWSEFQLRKKLKESNLYPKS
jgi:hypothetical protein